MCINSRRQQGPAWQDSNAFQKDQNIEIHLVQGCLGTHIKINADDVGKGAGCVEEKSHSVQL